MQVNTYSLALPPRPLPQPAPSITPSQHDQTKHHHPCPVAPRTTTAETITKKAGTRGSSFTPAEDETIAKSWIAASENQITGAEQKGADFYSSVAKLYNDKFKPANREIRSMESVKTRCKAVHKECMRFAGCYARVLRLKPTGVSPSDMLNLATALYNGLEMQSVQDDCGKPFRFVQAWRILKKHEKYMGAGVSNTTGEGTKYSSPDQSAASKSTENGATLINDDHDEPSPRRDRPVGRKRAKELQQKKEATAKKLKLAAETVDAQRERNQALQRHYEIMLFTKAPVGCDDSDAIEYFKIMRIRALNAIREEEKRKKPKEKPVSNGVSVAVHGPTVIRNNECSHVEANENNVA